MEESAGILSEMQNGERRGKKRENLSSLFLLAWSCAFLLACPVAVLTGGEGSTFLADYFRILTSPSKLVTDYFAIGGLGSTLLNAGLCGLFCNAVILLTKVTPDGRVVAGYFLVVAHCFYGLNLLNLLPPFFGVIFFCLVTKKKIAGEVPTAFFATSLGPFISDFLFRYTLGDAYVFGEVNLTVTGVVLSLLFGIACGFVIPALLPGTTAMHRGFNLYKAGLAIGLLGTFVYALLYRTLGVAEPETLTRYNELYAQKGFSHSRFMNLFFLLMFALSILLGFLLNGKSFAGYRNLWNSHGHNVDFSKEYGLPLCLVNFGIYGIFFLAYINFVVLLSEGVGFTGPTCGVVIAAMTFAFAGQTPKNVMPILLGYMLLWAGCAGVSLLCGREMTWSLSTQGYINGLAFATGLCPFAGKYGWKIGTAAGFTDAIICTSTAAMHGGFVLYNGGFAAGLTALILVPILDYYHVREKHPDTV